MKYASILALGAALGLAAPGLASAECTPPSAPASVDGAKATLDQMKTAQREVSGYITASDDYQTCLIEEVKAKKAEAEAAKTKLDPTLVKTADDRIKENQAEKERVGKAFNAAAKAFKAANPS